MEMVTATGCATTGSENDESIIQRTHQLCTKICLVCFCWCMQWKYLEGLSGGGSRSPRALAALSFSDIGELGTRIQFSISDDSQVDVDVHINGEDVIPNYELRQTARGKLSKKNMAKSKYYELYQDHICSSIYVLAFLVTFGHFSGFIFRLVTKKAKIRCFAIFGSYGKLRF